MKYIICSSFPLLYLSFFPSFYFSLFTSWCKKTKLPNIHNGFNYSVSSPGSSSFWFMLLHLLLSFVYPLQQFIQFFLCTFHLPSSHQNSLYSSSNVHFVFRLYFHQKTLFRSSYVRSMMPSSVKYLSMQALLSEEVTTAMRKPQPTMRYLFSCNIFLSVYPGRKTSFRIIYPEY
jgi:hypothetical protein